MLPGFLFAAYYFKVEYTGTLLLEIFLGVLATCFIASANYVINEWLDADFDKYHPLKKNRPSVVNKLNPNFIYIEYFLLTLVGLSISFYISMPFFITELVLLIMGIIYNVEPIRSKDKVYLDVLSESVNNPIRFCLGWFLIVPDIYPPISILVAYWMGGAFLMATKRFSEYRFISDKTTASLYRKSFKHYNEVNLLISVFFYALSSSFFLGIFLIKNKIELLLSFPFFAILFAWYLKIGFEKDSSAQRPEKMYKKRGFISYIIFFAILLIILIYVDIEPLNWFLKNRFH
ncbi:MAG: UbiA family prenyltransferase [Candidatus Cyclobacteriaceae bacterium M3_2C_046]